VEEGEGRGGTGKSQDRVKGEESVRVREQAREIREERVED